MTTKARVCAVSYLNTTPLTWGLLKGAQQGVFDLELAIPSVCADKLRKGDTDIGLVPLIEVARQPELRIVPGIGLACQGQVRSVFLVSKMPFGEVGSFCADTGSRTSVVLVQILAAHMHGTMPRVLPHTPNLDEMLELADAALIIGDPALRIDPAMDSWRGQPVQVYDLGLLWWEMTGLPMVFAVWAARPLPEGVSESDVVTALLESAEFGLLQIEDIVASDSVRCGLQAGLAREYLTRYIRFTLGDAGREAIQLYVKLAAELGLAGQAHELQYLKAPRGGIA